jgi:hypothetical protein
MSLVYYYLSCKQWCTNFYNGIIINLFGFKNITMIINGKQQNVIYRYIVYAIISKMIAFLSAIRMLVNIKTNKLQLIKVSETGEKTIIIEDNILSLYDVAYKLKTVTPDDTMIDTIFITFELINTDNNKVCLKELILKYKDLNCEYQHTLENIFEFNNIKYDKESRINIKVFKNKKMVSFDLPFQDVRSKHINHFLNL